MLHTDNSNGIDNAFQIHRLDRAYEPNQKKKRNGTWYGTSYGELIFFYGKNNEALSMEVSTKTDV